MAFRLKSLHQMLKLLGVLLVFVSALKAQPHYTKLRAGIGVEALGFAPVGMIFTDMPFSYRSKGFWNSQFGVGNTESNNSRLTFSMSGAVTYNWILNPYHRSLCSPAPAYNHFESYLETGFALGVFDPHHHALPEHLRSNSYFSPAGLLGVRIHYVTERWIYFLKARLTPFLDRQPNIWGAAAIGWGWR